MQHLSPLNGVPVPEAKKKRNRPGNSSAIRQALELQALLMADARNPETTATCRTQIARAFCECEETKRKLKMRPLPGSLKPEPKHKRKPSPIAPSEPIAVVPVAVAPAQPDTMPSGAPICHSPSVATSDGVSQSDSSNSELKP